MLTPEELVILASAWAVQKERTEANGKADVSR